MIKKTYFILIPLFVIILSVRSFATIHIVTSKSDTGVGTLRNRITNATSGDTIKFSTNLLTSGYDEITLRTAVNINKRLVIKGLYTSSDTLFISGNNLTNIFTANFLFAADKTLVLDSLIIINGNTNGKGGGLLIFNADTVTINNSIIRNCTADGDGGAIQLESSSVTTIGLCNLIMHNTNITNNTSINGSGGGIKVRDYSCQLDIKNCEITHNSSFFSGAGINLYSETGSSVSIYPPRFNFSGTKLSYNTSLNGGGGGLYGYFLTASIINCELSHNSVQDNGGALALTQTELIIHNSVLDSNESASGGAIHLFGGKLELDSTDFMGNTATFLYPFGGAVFITSVDFDAKCCNFYGNRTIGTYGQGGAINTFECELNLIHSTFTKNQTSHEGGAIWMESNYGGLRPFIPWLIKNCRFDSNSAVTGGGAIWSRTNPINPPNSFVEIDSCSFRYNTAVDYGGAISSKNDSLISIKNTTIEKNTGGYGGGIHFKNNSGLPISIIDCTIDDNIGTFRGGGIHVTGGSPTIVNILNTTISRNDVLNNSPINNNGRGGGIYIQSNNLYLNVTNSTINNNTAVREGGGIFSYPTIIGEVTLRQSTLVNNQSSYRGGGFSLFANSNAHNSDFPIRLINSTLYGNQATSGGGGVYLFSPLKQASTSAISSIIGGNIASSSPISLTSLGYNIFTDVSVPGSISSDQLGITPSILSLSPLQFNGGTTRTMQPRFGSPAINLGTPTDTTPAQNGNLLQRRDVGAAELGCLTTRDTIQVTASCQYQLQSGRFVATTGLHIDTLINAAGCDSLLFIDLTLTLKNSSYAMSATGLCGYLSPSGKVWRSSGRYSDTIPNTAGCDSIISIALILFNSLNTTVSVSGVDLTAVQNNVTYQWLDCNNSFAPIAAATNQNFSASANGNYAVQLSSQFCATDTSICQPINSVSLREIDEAENLILYPNPTSQYFFITGLNQPANYVIYTLTGKKLTSGRIENEDIIDLTNYDNGTYLLKINGKYHKVIKQN